MNSNVSYYTGPLPAGVLPTALERIDRVAQEVGYEDCCALATAVYKSLATEYRGGTLNAAMNNLGVGTSAALLTAINTYISLKTENPNICFRRESGVDLPLEASALAEADDYEDKDADMNGSGSDISDIALFLIDNIVSKTKVTNRYDVMTHVCEILEHRYGSGDRLEQNLRKLHLKTTKDVLRAVDIYFIMKKLYPDTVFGRKRMYSAWASSFNACLPDDKSEDGGCTDRSVKEAS